MAGNPPEDVAVALARVRAQAAEVNVRVTQHAQQEMVEEHITLGEILQTIPYAVVLENYPEHQRGACCLLYGDSPLGRPLHVVCTTTLPRLIIITAYVPQPPRWATPTERRERPDAMQY